MQGNYKFSVYIVWMLILLPVFTSCNISRKGDRVHGKAAQASWEGYEKATVINYTLDGCTWMLELEDGTKLQPDQLKPEFQKDKLNVWIRYTIKKGGNGICMAGKMIILTEIELRK